MAVKRKKTGLPNGWQYKLVSSKRGKISKADEPMIVFSKDGICMKYRLIEDTWERSFCDVDILETDFDEIENWMALKKGYLFSELELHHFIQFEEGSSCYYDFMSRKLLGAQGKKNDKSINGEPKNFTNKEWGILEVLVENRNSHCDYEVLCLAADISTEVWSSAVRNLTVLMNRIKNYDASLRNTIGPAVNEGYTYKGNADSWVIGNDFLSFLDEEGEQVTLEKVFSLISHFKVLVSNIKPSADNPLRVILSDNATINDKLAFLIPSDFINSTHSTSMEEALFRGKKMESDICLINIYKQASRGDMLNRLWDHIKGWIFENYKASISASSYYGMNNVCPETIAEVFENPPRDYSKYIQRIYSPTKEYIENSVVAEEFFKKRNIDVEKENSSGVDIFDYIVALVLASFYYCKCLQTEEIAQLKKLYRDKLYAAIQERFSVAVDEGALPLMTRQEEIDYLSTCQFIEEVFALAEAAIKQFNEYYGVEKFKLSMNNYVNDDPNNHNTTPGRKR